MMFAWTYLIILLLLNTKVDVYASPELSVPAWSPDRPSNMPEIVVLDVMCYTDKMTVTVKFSSPFNGMVFSKGSYGHKNCVYVTPNTGKTDYNFDILYDQCGTKPDLQGKFYENTIVIQYEKDLIELWDEAKRLRCEWANDYRQLTESMPAVKIDDLTVIELNFQGDNVDCWMEIQEGKGPWASHISGIVPIGSTLTLVVAISDPSGEFDMMVRSCVAHDGTKPPLALTDERGCILRPKMFSNFLKTRTKDGRASVITYAHFSAFKFPDTMQVNIQCKVVICRHGCPKPCSSELSLDGLAFPGHRLGPGGPGLQPSPTVGKLGSPGVSEANRRQDQFLENSSSGGGGGGGGSGASPSSRPTYAPRNGIPEASQKAESPPHTQSHFPASNNQDISEASSLHHSQAFPYGPRSFAGPEAAESGRKRKTRSVHDDKELRVSYSYQAISRTDLAFAPNVSSDSVSVYAGRRSADAGVSYGVCLSIPGFGALFASLGMFAVTAVLVAVVCGYHYRSLGKNQKVMMMMTTAGGGGHPSPNSTSSIVLPRESIQSRTVMHLNTLTRTKVQ